MEFLRYPQVITDYFNRRVFGPPQRFTAASTCSWIGHQVSGLRHATIRALSTRSRFGSVTVSLNLATHRNSPARSTKSTTSHLNVLCLFVSIGFHVLFHSPPGVLFTFPSQYFSTIGYQVVFRLGGWAPRIPYRFHVSVGTLDTRHFLQISSKRLSLSMVTFPTVFDYPSECLF